VRAWPRARQQRTDAPCSQFDKPRGERDYPELGLEATVKALIDAGLTYDDVETASVGYCCECARRARQTRHPDTHAQTATRRAVSALSTSSA
jgi:hypothetical protein